MKTAHDLIMELCASREAKEEARRNRVKVNIHERWRLIKETQDCFLSDYAELATPASKEAHRAYTEAAYKHRACVRAINRYAKERKC